MATIIDALVVTLGLDPSDYEKGRKKVDDSGQKMSDSLIKRLKGVESETKKTSAIFSELRSDVLALMAVFLGGRGLEEFIKDIGFADAAMARTAKTVNMSVSELAQWKGAADLAGGSGENLIGTLQGLSDQYNQWQLTGESSIAPALRALQTINPNLQLDKNGKMADLGEFLLQLSDTVKNMPAGRARSLLQMLGIDSDTINVILQGREALSGYLAEVKRLQGPVQESAIAGKELQTAYAEAGESFKGAGRVLLVEIAPALVEVLHLLRDFGLWAQQHPKIIEAAFWTLTVAVLALSFALGVNLARMALTQTVGAFSLLLGIFPKLLLWLAVLTDGALPSLSGAFLATGAAMEATPIGWLITGIAALAYLADQLYEHWHEIPGWWHDMWAQMGSDVDEAWAKAHPDASIIEKLHHRTGHDSDGTPVTIDTTQGRDGFSRPGSPPARGGSGGGNPLADIIAQARASIDAGGGPVDLVTLKTASGQSYQVNSKYADQFSGFVSELESRGYKINSIGGYSDRNIAGTNTPSFHAQGAAIDINPGANPVNGGRSDLPADISAIAAKYGLGWGGNWKSKKDPMHFSVAAQEGGSANLAHIRAMARAAARPPAPQKTSTTIHNDNRVGSLTVNSRAADAAGIAKDVRRELENHGHATQANSGLA